MSITNDSVRPAGRPMRTAITGGIGSGKSYVCRLLKEQGISVYDCDSHAKRLMVESPQLRQRITALIGPEAYSPCSGGAHTLNKAAVASFLMSSADNAKALEDIVHPAVIDDFLASGMEWVESAILYESGLYMHVDRIVAVTAPEEVRIARVMERDAITKEKALEWIRRQLPQDWIADWADFIIVNDGQTPLLPQVLKILSYITNP